MNPSDSVESSQTNEDSKSEQLKYRLKAGAFLTFAGGFGLFGGFAFALAASKKADPKAFDQGLVCNNYYVNVCTTNFLNMIIVSLAIAEL